MNNILIHMGYNLFFKFVYIKKNNIILKRYMNTTDDKKYTESITDSSENNNSIKTESGKTYRSKMKYDIEYQKRDYVREKMKVYKKKYYDNNKEEIIERKKKSIKERMENDPEYRELEKQKIKIKNQKYREKKKLEKINNELKNNEKYLPLPIIKE